MVSDFKHQKSVRKINNHPREGAHTADAARVFCQQFDVRHHRLGVECRIEHLLRGDQFAHTEPSVGNVHSFAKVLKCFLCLHQRVFWDEGAEAMVLTNCVCECTESDAILPVVSEVGDVCRQSAVADAARRGHG